MLNYSLRLKLVGRKTVRDPWHQNEHTNIQRIYYIMGGKGYYIDQNGIVQPFVEGNLYIFPYNFVSDFHSDPQNPLDHLFLEFFTSPPLIAEAPIVRPIEKDSTTAHLLHYIASFITEHDLHFPFTAKIDVKTEKDQKRMVLYHSLKLLLLQLGCELTLPFSEDSVISEALSYIHAHYKEKITVEELAVRAGFTKEHFIRRFKLVMQKTPGEYLREYRLTFASQMIAEGATLTEAALECGYDYDSSLSRALKNIKNQK